MYFYTQNPQGREKGLRGRKRKLETFLEAAKAALTTFFESEKRIANPSHRDSGEAY